MIELLHRIRMLEQRLDRLLAGLSLPPKSNHAAVAAPGANDDENDGYQAGSLWIDTVADDAYICVDPAAGAAVWLQL